VRRDRMFDYGPDLRLDAVLRTPALVHHAAVTIRAVDEVPSLWRLCRIAVRWQR